MIRYFLDFSLELGFRLHEEVILILIDIKPTGHNNCWSIAYVLESGVIVNHLVVMKEIGTGWISLIRNMHGLSDRLGFKRQAVSLGGVKVEFAISSAWLPFEATETNGVQMSAFLLLRFINSASKTGWQFGNNVGQISPTYMASKSMKKYPPWKRIQSCYG